MPQPPARSTIPSPPTQRQTLRSEEAAFPTRRAAAAAAAAAGAPSAIPSAQSGTRERASFVPPLDSEWDTPAFQRRGQ